MSKKQIKRFLKFHGLDLELNITKVAAVDVEKKFFYIEEYKPDEYRLTYSKSLIDSELSNLTHIEMIREG